MKFKSINLAEAARRMKKSRHWLYQRINQNIVNGKPAFFKPNEMELFISVVREMWEELGNELSNSTNSEY